MTKTPGEVAFDKAAGSRLRFDQHPPLIRAAWEVHALGAMQDYPLMMALMTALSYIAEQERAILHGDGTGSQTGLIPPKTRKG
jgi:hypothetical protein